jgi:hypothetical protein
VSLSIAAMIGSWEEENKDLNAVSKVKSSSGSTAGTLIGIHERRKNGGSAKKPPKGRFVRGVRYVAAALR